MLDKPYYRIARISKNGHEHNEEYILDKRYAEDRFVLIHAYQVIEKDLRNLLEYIEPSDDNLGTYSHRLYELLLRSSTEFETNCKGILKSNGYALPEQPNMEHYKMINLANRISKYEVKINSWYPEPKIIKPLEAWDNEAGLSWWQSYNHVKHDRSKLFNEATFENTIYSVAALCVVLFSQFNSFVFNSHNDEEILHQGDRDNFYYGGDSLFSIRPFIGWEPKEQYNIANWHRIKSGADVFDKFSF